MLWAFLKRYAPAVSPETHPRLDALVGYAIRYFHDFVKPKKKYRPPTEDERKALADLSAALARVARGVDRPRRSSRRSTMSAAAIPTRRCRRTARPACRSAWFNMLYQVLLGEEHGPRFGSFAALYGLGNTRALIAKALNGELTGSPR